MEGELTEEQKKVIEGLTGRERAQFKQLRGLKYNQGKSFDTLVEMAKDRIRKYKMIDNIGVHKKFSNEKDRKDAKDLLGKYIEDFEINNISDKNDLADLVYFEIITMKLEEKLAKLSEHENKPIPHQLMRSIRDNRETIAEIKENLGIKKEEKQTNAFKALEKLKKKAKAWRERNQGTRTRRCPHCQKMIVFKMKTDQYDADEHPFFDDKILCNRHLMKMYVMGLKFWRFCNKHSEHELELKEKSLKCENCDDEIEIPVVKKGDVAKTLGASKDYIDWLLEQWKDNSDYKEIMKDYIGESDNNGA